MFSPLLALVSSSDSFPLALSSRSRSDTTPCLPFLTSSTAQLVTLAISQPSLTQNLPRCTPLLAEATRIARTGASIVRARAAVLGFGVAGGGRVLASISEQRDVSSTLDRDDSDAEDESDNAVVGVPDPDVLPTLLAYRDGELEKTWVRVDFEVGREGLEGLLLR
jgi:hypothetical protein